MTIRPANESDAIGINKVSKFLGYPELPANEAQNKLSRLLRSSDHEIYVAEKERRIVGWLHMFFAPRMASDDFYEIAGLVIDPCVRRQGIARALEGYVSEKHKWKLRVRCNETRTDAHRFYESCGFDSLKAQRIFEKGS